MVKRENKGNAQFEYSAGGVAVNEQGKLLMVKVKNLKGEIVWTFPKGHVEKGEKTPETAVREVREETGWECRIVEPLDTVTYWFKWNSALIRKAVRWFLMKPVKHVSEHDKLEIIDVEWVDQKEAVMRATYPSDKKLLKKLPLVTAILACCFFIAGCQSIRTPVGEQGYPETETRLGARSYEIPVRIKGEVYFTLEKGGVLVFKSADGEGFCLQGEPSEKLTLLIGNKPEGAGLECEVTGYIIKKRKCIIPGFEILEVLEYRY